MVLCLPQPVPCVGGLCSHAWLPLGQASLQDSDTLRPPVPQGGQCSQLCFAERHLGQGGWEDLELASPTPVSMEEVTRFSALVFVVILGDSGIVTTTSATVGRTSCWCGGRAASQPGCRSGVDKHCQKPGSEDGRMLTGESLGLPGRCAGSTPHTSGGCTGACSHWEVARVGVPCFGVLGGLGWVPPGMSSAEGR